MPYERGLVMVASPYPNGDPHFVVRFDGAVIGSFVPVEGGYLPHGCRKAIPTPAGAVASVVGRRARLLRAKADRLERAWREAEGKIGPLEIGGDAD